MARLRLLPEVIGRHLPVGLDRVDAPAATAGVAPQAPAGGEDGAGGWGLGVAFAAQDEDDGAEEENDGGEGVCEPEADVLGEREG